MAKAPDSTSPPPAPADGAAPDGSSPPPEPPAPPAVTPNPPASPVSRQKTATQLKAEYDEILGRVQRTAGERSKLEAKLQEEVRAKLKKHVGDLEAMKEQKRQAYTAWQAQLKVENDAAEHAAAMAKTRADAEASARAAAAANKAQAASK